MMKMVEDFGKDLDQTPTDGRLNAPAALRNQDAIKDVLCDIIKDKKGHVLEIGSGTGQHAIHFARHLPEITWWPSDPNDDHITSINAWTSYTQSENIKPAIKIDTSHPWDLGEEGKPPLENLIGVFCANVCHISPWSVTEGLFLNAGSNLSTETCLILYGPFKRDGDFLSQGNIDFNQALRARNSEWGIRDTNDISICAKKNNLKLEKILDMPANNSTLILTKI